MSNLPQDLIIQTLRQELYDCKESIYQKIQQERERCIKEAQIRKVIARNQNHDIALEILHVYRDGGYIIIVKDPYEPAA